MRLRVKKQRALRQAENKDRLCAHIVGSGGHIVLEAPELLSSSDFFKPLLATRGYSHMTYQYAKRYQPSPPARREWSIDSYGNFKFHVVWRASVDVAYDNAKEEYARVPSGDDEEDPYELKVYAQSDVDYSWWRTIIDDGLTIYI